MDYIHSNRICVRSLRVANFVAFIVNLVGSYLAVFGVYGLTQKEVSDRHASLLTPIHYSFHIWPLIFLSEGVFSITQMFTKLVPDLFITHIVSFWWVFSSIFQVLWSISFAREWLIASQILIMLNFASLALITYNILCLRKNAYKGNGVNPIRFPQCAIAVFPFILHYAWLGVAMLSNLNILLSAKHLKDAHPHALISGAMFGLGGMIFLSVLHSLTGNALGMVPLVIAWGAFGIAENLRMKNINNDLIHRVDYTTLQGMKHAFYGVFWMSIGLAVIAIARNMYWFFIKGPKVIEKMRSNQGSTTPATNAYPIMLGLDEVIAPCASCEHMDSHLMGDMSTNASLANTASAPMQMHI